MPKSRELFASPNIYVLCTLHYLLIIKMYFIIICGKKKNRWEWEGRRERGPGRKEGGRGEKEKISP